MPTVDGPLVRKLIVYKMALILVPNGAGLDDIQERLQATHAIGDAASQAQAWVRLAIQRVKATDDNLFGDDDEAIAGEILRQIAEKERERVHRLRSVGRND